MEEKSGQAENREAVVAPIVARQPRVARHAIRARPDG